jgi:hypothetical protein
MCVSLVALESAPRRRLTPAEAPRCKVCGTRYVARNSYPARTRYQRACGCESVPFARFLSRPIDFRRLTKVDRVRMGLFN